MGERWPIAMAAAVNGPTRKQRRSVLSPQTNSASLTWSATSGNGRRIVGTRATKARRLTGQPGRAAIAVSVSSVAAPGATFPAISARRTANGSLPSIGTAILPSGSPGPLPPKPAPTRGRPTSPERKPPKGLRFIYVPRLICPNHDNLQARRPWDEARKRGWGAVFLGFFEVLMGQRGSKRSSGIIFLHFRLSPA